MEAFAQTALVGQAIQRGQIQFQTVNPRIFTSDNHKTVDDRPYGGGDGMVMLAEPLHSALGSLKLVHARYVYLSPQGQKWNHSLAKKWALDSDPLVLLSGRYAGVDQRLVDHWNMEEISLGDYVLSGGEVAAMAIIESISRWIPGVLGHADSAAKDSFEDNLLEPPQFTRPAIWEGRGIPQSLLSGHHSQIDVVKKHVSVLHTKKKRPDIPISPALRTQAEAWQKTQTQEELKLWGLGEL